MSRAQKTATERYQKISQLEHILKRPDTYIGSVEFHEQEQWIFDEATECLMEKHVKIVPGLFKIFDEILVNAADNKVRDPSMKKIEVTITAEENLIEVKNDGKSIPIEIHQKEKIYIPELIFGHLLTSSNYDDEEKKVTGGRNGYGAKLCNIFSKEFILETADPKKGKKYVQKWENNMNVCNPPTITSYKKGPSYTKVSFKPDLSRFNMEVLDNDILGVMRRRVYDINGSVRDISVYLNGKSLKIRNFKNYVELYLKSLEKMKQINNNQDASKQDTPTILYERISDRWEVAFAVSDISFQQISFVNSIATTSGGTHVNYVTDQIVKKVGDYFKKKKKRIKPFQIKNNIFIFVNCLIENPAFTSQTKEQLTTRVKDFGSRCEISNDYINKILKTDLATRIFDAADENDAKALKQSDGSRKSRITEYPKLEDANKAGTKDGYKCTLILTEGDSALSLAVLGLAVVGRDHYGCYPLRGKMLNVREASADQILKNAEIQAIKKIMGLQHRKKYEDTKSLRYGHLMIMTDQDHDGSHIKGLIINFIESSFPGLLDIPGFLVEFITPIVKVTITKPKKQSIAFYNMPDYEKWREEESYKYSWKQKYYKGLGTSQGSEVREYFADLDKHLKTFHALEGNDKDLIDLAFSKKKADDRKEWLRQYEPGTVLDPNLTEIPISDFINKELILFSLADNVRSIPNILDGLKPGQRKVMFGSFKRNLRSEIKVSQLAPYVSEATSYHHGEQSLEQTIIGLAQSFVGTNNIYLLMPNGAFGTRATGGKDAAASRYIYTELNKLTRKIFHPADDPLFNYLQDDEKTVEPEWYLPIIPMVLVNGAEGIGTGWSTNIPSFNPEDIVRNIRYLMDDQELEPLHPWFRGWTGTVEMVERQRYRMYGRIEQVGPNKLEITELPAKTWTSTIKEYLLLGISGNERTKSWIKDMEEQHSHDIKFIITLTDEEMKKTKKIGFYERFKLISPISMLNMVGFNAHGKINRYNDPNEILTEFYYVRLEYYQKRKDYLTEILQWELEKLSYQVKFIKMIVDKQLTVTNKPRKQIIEEFENLGFPRFNKKGKPYYGKIDSIEKTEDEDAEENGESNNNNLEEGNETVNGPEETYGTFEYLLGMRIWSLTKERYDKLMKQQQEKQTELESLLKLSAKDIWNNDLDEFMKSYHDFINLDQEMREGEAEGKKLKTSAKRKRGRNDDDYDPSKKKPKRRITKKIKEEANFKRVLLEPKVVVKPKRVARIKKETTTEEVNQTQSPTPFTPSQSTADSITETSKPTTIFDNVVKKEEPATGISAFTSKFKKITDVFDKMDSKDSEDTVDITSKDGEDSTGTSSKDELATLVETSQKPLDKKAAPKRNKKAVELLDESDLEILSDAQDDAEDDEEIQPRKRNSRARTPKQSYVEEAIELSDDSFIDDDDENEEAADDSDASFGSDE
ncbi:similar to Saccharomyces cerevisiae YNL088W TOP2 Topoisomerase II [Maudiozyma saulgeensis]|uniref:DNA topoisomerase 2 n=1 Tax=Maudiozyma saulgeensis TaxID=1789683 RepID=A0A1X7QYU6_9SACH|nr:similar to Saccharomyces cerevisiae YNL088W TOP2 Topoisomerase II [Kazachstania saulgeensis]